MKTRNFTLYALGLAAAISMGSAVAADAQQTPRRRATPARRIPVRKDVPAPMRADTVIVTRVDTVTVRRVDTLTGPTVMRYDTVTRMVYPPLQRLPGLFFGLGLGSTIPMNNIRALVKDGYGGQAQVGFFPMNSPLGLRADVTYGTMPGRDTDCPSCLDAKLLTVGGDVILRMPLDRTSKLNPVLYVFGGGGYAIAVGCNANELEGQARRLGGEGRFVRIESNTSVPLPRTVPDELKAALQGETRVRCVLVTPALFETNGWFPDWMKEDLATHKRSGEWGSDRGIVSVTLVATAIARAQSYSGWRPDIDPKGGPGAGQAFRVVPAGSVFWFDVAEGDGPKLWGRSLCQGQWQRDGWGICLVGLA